MEVDSDSEGGSVVAVVDWVSGMRKCTEERGEAEDWAVVEAEEAEVWVVAETAMAEEGSNYSMNTTTGLGEGGLGLAAAEKNTSYTTSIRASRSRCNRSPRCTTKTASPRRRRRTSSRRTKSSSYCS